jgi:hypothetical protein
VLAVSVVFVQEATNATPRTATMDVRRDFFIGVSLLEKQQELCCPTKHRRCTNEWSHRTRAGWRPTA